jgi:succinoglycan biosynthesis protein ExoA
MGGTSAEVTTAISVVLPVLNEERDIGALLQSLVGQEPFSGGFELIVSDGGSTDSTVEIVEGLARERTNLHIVYNRGRLSSAGRNAGSRAARGAYVVFLDGHCRVPRSDYLRRVWEIFTETGADCLCRPQPLEQVTKNSWNAAIAAARHSPWGHNPRSGIYGHDPGFTDPRSTGASYTRECLEELGGYDERFDACEDVEFNHRVAVAGYRSYIHPDLAIYYRPRSTPGELYKQMFRYGRGRARLWVKHRSCVPWPLLAPSVYFIIVSIWAALDGPLRGAESLIPAGAVALAVVVEAIRLGGVSAHAGRILVAFLTIYVGLLLGFWRGLLEFPRFRKVDMHARATDGRPAV